MQQEKTLTEKFALATKDIATVPFRFYGKFIEDFVRLEGELEERIKNAVRSGEIEQPGPVLDFMIKNSGKIGLAAIGGILIGGGGVALTAMGYPLWVSVLAMGYGAPSLSIAFNNMPPLRKIPVLQSAFARDIHFLPSLAKEQKIPPAPKA